MDILTLAQINKLKKGGGVGYIELGRVLYPEQTLTYAHTRPSATIRFEGNIYELVVGNEYLVYWNGKEYRIRSTEVGSEVRAVRLDGFDGETQKFHIEYYPSLDDTDIYSYEVGTFTIRVETPATIHPIDPKFLPAGAGGGLPVVELTTQPEDADSFGLNAEENAQLDALNGMPFVLKCTGLVGGKRPYHLCAIANYCAYPYYDYYGYEVVAESAVFAISRTSSGWSIQFRATSL